MPNVFGGNNYTIAPKAPGYQPDEFEQEAIETINQERAAWDDESVFITDKISYLMRNVIKKARKFYYGVFDAPKDETTGEDKSWVPLTEWSVESVVKSIDLDTKDILIQPGNPDAVNITEMIRAIILHYMKKMGFGQLLNDFTRVLARDGTVVVKTVEEIEKGTDRKIIRSEIVDLLNIWIDPAVSSIDNAPAIIQRSYLTEADIESYSDVWKNVDAVTFSTNVPNILDTWSNNRGKVPYMEVWERWGKIKKSWVTKNHKDDDGWVEGHIVASGQRGASVVHLIRENPRKDGIKPYEEAWYKRVDGRWFGRGIAEMLFGLQEYSNQVVNMRKNNGLILQNGIFLVRKGGGLTSDVISSMVAGGALPVTDIDRDVKQLQVQDVRSSSYSDEDRINLYSDRVTGAFDINRGEAGMASTSATATLTQDKNIRDTFVLIQEGMGFFIERLIMRQYIPMIKEIMKQGDIVRITGEPAYLERIDEVILDNKVDEFKSNYIEQTGYYPEQVDIDGFMQGERENLKRMGKQRFITYLKSVFDHDVSTDVSINDERFNRVVAVQQLKETLVSISRLPFPTRLDTDAIVREIFNLMGLRGEFFLKNPIIPALSAEATQAGRLMKNAPAGMPTEGTAIENANGLPGMGQAVATGQPTSALPQVRYNVQGFGV